MEDDRPSSVWIAWDEESEERQHLECDCDSPDLTGGLTEEAHADDDDQ